MAFTPCAADRRMYAGGSQTAFVRLVHGSESYGGKRQWCPEHFAEFQEKLRERAILVSVGDEFVAEPSASHCGNCNAALNGNGTALFVSAFPRGAKPSQWYQQYCATCAPVAAEMWGVEP